MDFQNRLATLVLIFGCLIFISIVIAFVAVLWSKTKKEKAKEDSVPNPEPTDALSDTDGYQSKYLLTKNEWINFKALKKYASRKSFVICPKVRLADLVEPVENLTKQQKQTRFNRVRSKHVDFVLCNSDMHVKLIVELDDASHERADRKRRDSFVDDVLTKCGYKIVHLREINQAAYAIMDKTLRDDLIRKENTDA
jgi:very-short-patch-repair endonuclease